MKSSHTEIIAVIVLAILSTGCQKKMFGVTHDTVVTPSMVIVEAGQSNNTGDREPTEQPLDPRITVVNGLRKGPSYFAAQEILRTQPTVEQITLIKCAVGGTSIYQWSGGGEMTERCMNLISHANLGHVDLVLFYQGEQEAYRPSGATDWTNNFKGFVNEIRGKYGNIPVVFAQIGMLDSGAIYADQIRMEQTHSIFDVKMTMITTLDLPTMDGEHHDITGDEIVGQRFSQGYENLILSN